MLIDNGFAQLSSAWLSQKAGRDPCAYRFRGKAHYLLIVHMNLAQPLDSLTIFSSPPYRQTVAGPLSDSPLVLLRFLAVGQVLGRLQPNNGRDEVEPVG